MLKYKWCQAHKTSPRAPLQVAAKWKISYHDGMVSHCNTMAVNWHKKLSSCQRGRLMFGVIEYFAKSRKVTQAVAVLGFSFLGAICEGGGTQLILSR